MLSAQRLDRRKVRSGVVQWPGRVGPTSLQVPPGKGLPMRRLTSRLVSMDLTSSLRSLSYKLQYEPQGSRYFTYYPLPMS